MTSRGRGNTHSSGDRGRGTAPADSDRGRGNPSTSSTEATNPPEVEWEPENFEVFPNFRSLPTFDHDTSRGSSASRAIPPASPSVAQVAPGQLGRGSTAGSNGRERGTPSGDRGRGRGNASIPSTKPSDPQSPEWNPRNWRIFPTWSTLLAFQRDTSEDESSASPATLQPLPSAAQVASTQPELPSATIIEPPEGTCVFYGVGCFGGSSQYSSSGICTMCKGKHAVLLLRMSARFVENQNEHYKIRKRFENTFAFLWNDKGPTAQKERKSICVTEKLAGFFDRSLWKEKLNAPFEITNSWSHCELVEKVDDFCTRCQTELDRLRMQQPQPEHLCIFGGVGCFFVREKKDHEGKICDMCLYMHPWLWERAVHSTKKTDPKYGAYLEVLVEILVPLSIFVKHADRSSTHRFCKAPTIQYGSQEWINQGSILPTKYWPQCQLIKREEPEHIAFCTGCIINHDVFSDWWNRPDE